jgi:SAM-dependent methyltransferase|tara:strand:+ start:679 stop:1950 length:1272 start_codon:yes stop_codon:yes gene_type:complete
MVKTLKENYYHRSTCRLCESNNLKLVIPLEKIPITEKYVGPDERHVKDELYPIDVYMCLDCSHVQLLDVIDPNILWDDFTFRTAQAQIIIEHMKDIAKATYGKYEIPEKSLVIDVGSNDGTLLQGFKDHQMKVVGIDPAEKIAMEANNAGIPTIPKFLTKSLVKEIVKEHGKAYVVTCFNAFAHTDDMNQYMSCIADMVAPEGIFIFEVSYLVDIIDDLLLGAIIHEHLCHHSVIPMVEFLKRHGMELISIERNHFQGGSFIGTAQHISGSRKVNGSVSETIEYEKKRKLHLPETIEVFSSRLSKLVDESTRLFSKWADENAVIAGFGAARSGPTLLAQFKIGNEISFIFDDHPQKVNKYTPGDKIKVYPTQELVKRMPDYTVILAWVHADTIISNNHEYLIKGGNFVLLLPEIKIISARDVI